MEYRSPLQDDCEESNNCGPLRTYTSGSGRYAPYTNKNIKQERYSTPYTERYKPANYPKELTDMFCANECKLCTVEMQSPIVAKMHYSGKQHLKKVKSYMNDWSCKTGLPVPEIVESNLSDKSIFPEYCEICSVHTKSTNDQLLHYSGKMHRKNMLDPANAKKKKKTYDTLDTSGRFGIGTDFSSKVPDPENEKKMEFDILKTKFICELCNVNAVSQEQLMQHLSGKKHKEKAEKNKFTTEKKDNPWKCTICNISFETSYLYNLHINGKRHEKNIKKKNIDKDYCETCNVSFTSPEHYQEHMTGKKHKKRFQSPDQKSTITCQFCPFVGNIENHDCDKSLKKIDFENLEKKWVCTVCHNMVFESETELNEHKSSDRHTLCVLNQDKGDPMNGDISYLYCILCKKQYNDYKEYTQHLFDEKHIKLSQEETNPVSNVDLFQCSVCNLTLTGKLKDQHVQSRQHIRESWKKDVLVILTDLANKDIVPSSYRCDDCKVTLLTFKQYSQHLLGEEHINFMIDATLLSMKHS